MRIVRSLPAIVLGFFAVCVALPAYAQYDFSSLNVSDFSLPNTSTSITLTMDPLHPRPGDRVHFAAQSIFLDLAHMNITWTAGGDVIAHGVGVVSADLAAGALGSVTEVHMDARSDTGNGTAHLTVVPTIVDLLYESDSYIPPFYTGRAVPSEGSHVRLQAIPFFKRPNGSYISTDAINFTWRRNGNVVTEASGVGRSTAVFPSPFLYGSDAISVEAIAVDNSESGDASLSVPSVFPRLMLYEDHPLFGEMYYRALETETSLLDTEMAFKAVPYFAPVQSPDDPSLKYAWTVNGGSIAPDPVRPSTLTVHSDPGAGAALIGVSITQSGNPIFSASDTWTVRLGSSGSSFSGSSSGSGNPFLPRN